LVHWYDFSGSFIIAKRRPCSAHGNLPPSTENAKAVADWSPAAGVRSDAQPNSKKAAVAAALLARASALLGQGDIGVARIVLERAIEMGSVQAS
jgi:hypothetical protein